jgi:hypothetical protein
MGAIGGVLRVVSDGVFASAYGAFFTASLAIVSQSFAHGYGGGGLSFGRV